MGTKLKAYDHLAKHVEGVDYKLCKSAHVFYEWNYGESPEDGAKTSDDVFLGRGGVC